MLPRQLKLQKNLEEFFFIQDGQDVSCLYCFKRNDTAKKDRMRIHFNAYHKHETEGYTDAQKKELWLSKHREYLQNFQRKEKDILLHNLETASCRVAYQIAKRSKPFVDGEFVKACAIDMLKALNLPEAAAKIQKVPLSQTTIGRRMDQIAELITNNLKNKISQSIYFSLALDESTDVKGTAQLLIFIRGVNKKFVFFEELAAVCHMHDRSTGRNIFDEVHAAANQLKLDVKKLVSVTTDGCPSMVGEANGFVGHMKRKLGTLPHRDPIVFLHCIIHQEQLCKNTLELSHVTDIVSKIVKSLRKSALKYRQFQQFLVDLDAEHIDVPYHSSVRWLSIGSVCGRVYELMDHIKQFFAEKEIDSFPQLNQKEFIDDFAYTVDVLKYLNEFNVKLQGANLFIHDMYNSFTEFMDKLKILYAEVSTNNFVSFPTLYQRSDGLTYIQCAKYQTIINNLINDFSQRFGDFRQLHNDFDALSNLLSVDPSTQRVEIQLELVELQLNSQFQEDMQTKSLPEALASLDDARFKNLKNWAQRLMVMFGSTYRCESAFSLMKFNKSKYRSQLTDSNLANILKICTSSDEPNFDVVL